MRPPLVTTAFLLLAGAASAQVSFEGYGRFGLGYQEDRSTEDTALVSRFRLNIDAMTETESGVTLAARVRLQADDSPSTNEQLGATLNGARFSASYGGLTLSAGNVAGVFDSAPHDGFEPGLEEFTGQYAGVDYGFLEYSSTGSGANAVALEYEFGQFILGGSYDPDAGSDNDSWDIGIEYAFNDAYSPFLGYGANDNDQSLLLAVLMATYDRLSVNLFLGDEDLNLGPGAADTDGMVYGVSAAIKVGAATDVLVSYGSGEGSSDTESYAIGFKHALGGGVSLRGGLGSEGAKDGTSEVIGDFGVKFDF